MAGRAAASVATNMAGRGTDIVLGGNVDFLTDQRLRERGLDRWNARGVRGGLALRTAHRQEEASKEAKEVIEAGGLACWAQAPRVPGGSTTSCRSGLGGLKVALSICRWVTS